MKKLLSIMLALVLILSMSTVAFADNVRSYDTSDAGSFTVKKTYKSDVQVTETLQFEATASENNPEANKNLTIENIQTTAESKNEDGSWTITVKYPSYSEAGTYEYTIKEKKGTTAGVTYTENTITVQIVVGYDNDNHKLKVLNTNNEYSIKNQNGKKTTNFENTFTHGSFTVAKDVSGTAANENDTFKITVKLTKPDNLNINTPITVCGEPVASTEWVNGVYTKELTISEFSGKQTFSNIPVGVKVEVTEDQTALNGYTYNGVVTRAATDNGVVDTEFTSMTIAAGANGDIVVKNSKDMTIETGIALDSMPYFLMLAVACMGLVVFFMKKRNAREY